MPRFLYVPARSCPTPFAELSGLLTDLHALSLPINRVKHMYWRGSSNSLASCFGSMCCIGVLCSSWTGIAAGAGGAGVKAAAANVLVTVEIPMMKINRRIEYFCSGLIGLLAFSPCLLQ